MKEMPEKLNLFLQTLSVEEATRLEQWLNSNSKAADEMAKLLYESVLSSYLQEN